MYGHYIKSICNFSREVSLVLFLGKFSRFLNLFLGAASVTAGTWRIFIMPLDTLKTTLQV